MPESGSFGMPRPARVADSGAAALQEVRSAVLDVEFFWSMDAKDDGLRLDMALGRLDNAVDVLFEQYEEHKKPLVQPPPPPRYKKVSGEYGEQGEQH